MSKLKKILLMCTACAVVAVLAIGGTLAYFTDRDSEANVFTVGDVSIKLNEDFEQGSTLIPGVDIKKEATITNTGDNDAWVWLTVLLPEEMGPYTAPDNMSASNNVVHWNYPKESAANITVDFNATPVAVDTDGDGVAESYYQTNMLWKNVLKAGETTGVMLSKVYMDTRVDVDPDGNLYWVVNGVATDLNWNVNEKGNPVIHVSAYAIQKNQFADVEAAYVAYNKQWGDNGAEYDSVNTADTWDGTSDISWYNETDTEFTIATAEQFAGFADLVDDGNNFEGKTVKLGGNIDLEAYDAEGNIICFDPIGSYRNDTAFKGIFNGEGYTISNLNQNTWALDNGYYYEDLGLGLFGLIENATIKELNMDGASVSGESALSGIVAAAAYGDCTFENIKVTNSQTADYQYYAGGIVAWASGDHKYINCDVDATTTIAAQWGDFDNSTGGIIGGAGGSATIYMKDCDVACRIDAYNDVTSSYQWYAYHRCGMLIGNTGKTQKINNTTYATAPQLTCENVTVTYGEWANYTYCEFAGKNWPYVRVQEGISNSAYSNPRYGHPTDANGNEVVDDNHVHNEGEDHFILCVFDQLYGGGQGVYGQATHDGVTVIYNNK